MVHHTPSGSAFRRDVALEESPAPAFELPGTARVPSSHRLDASSTTGDTWDGLIIRKGVTTDLDFLVAADRVH